MEKQYNNVVCQALLHGWVDRRGIREIFPISLQGLRASLDFTSCCAFYNFDHILSELHKMNASCALRISVR